MAAVAAAAAAAAAVGGGASGGKNIASGCRTANARGSAGGCTPGLALAGAPVDDRGALARVEGPTQDNCRYRAGGQRAHRVRVGGQHAVDLVDVHVDGLPRLAGRQRRHPCLQLDPPRAAAAARRQSRLGRDRRSSWRHHVRGQLADAPHMRCWGFFRRFHTGALLAGQAGSKSEAGGGRGAAGARLSPAA